MKSRYTRYGVFFTPTGDFAAAGAKWLGWDLETGRSVDLPNLNVVRRPQKYGFHGTLKPPFHLAEKQSPNGLKSAFDALCSDLAPVSIDGMAPTRIGGFVALVPQGNTDALAMLAGRAVSELDRFRAPPSEDEKARRRQSKLSNAQEAHLEKWGYPYVFDQFKFHMTLSGNLKGDELDVVLARAKSIFEPLVSTPLLIEAFSLVGQRVDGMFELIERRPLTG